MKRVVKGDPPESFQAWKAKANEEWQPDYKDLRNPEKRELHQQLLREQGWVCCYCGQRIDIDAGDVPRGMGAAHAGSSQSVGSHIEHFRPQEKYPDLSLDYGNLFVSCLRQLNRAEPVHCGHAKGNDFDGELAISPSEVDEQRFTYTLSGKVLPDREHGPADYMCKLLRLNEASLKGRRETVLSQVFDEVFLSYLSDEGVDAEQVTNDLRRLADGFRQPDDEGRLPSFGHVIARFAEQQTGR
ncbi:MAG: retron system putative HNH endonuclease [Lautropia sp.]|nr:retron system putative HNH endonuclease [Lautropia sp.]